MSHESNRKVAIVGGGLAGLAAASILSKNGIAITLFEASPHLGGRARSIEWQGHTLDNGQHILLGAYAETLTLLNMIGVGQTQLLRASLRLDIQGKFSLKTCPYLPAPLHILIGLLGAKGLSWYERLSTIRLMIHLKFIKFKLNNDEPLSSFLLCHKQPARLTKLLWEPLCLAALNTPLNTASAQVFINVLHDSFAKAKSDSDLLLTKTDLSTLLSKPIASYIKHNGGTIKSSTPVIQITEKNDCFNVKTKNNNEMFTHIIIATSPFRLADITQQLPALADAVKLVQSFTYQPISTIYIQYPTTVKLPFMMMGLSVGISQWVFDRGALFNQHGLFAVVISAKGSHQQLTQEALALKVMHELKISFPQLPQALWHKVITEKRATFSCDVSLKRPTQKTTIKNLYLAGDYTESDYPATIEGAIRSGVQCAQYIH